MRIGKFEIKNYFVFGIFCLLITFLIAGFIYGGIYVARKYSSGDNYEEMLIEVGKTVELPKDEEPIWMTVTDPKKRSDQPFFTEAEVGDKVIIFSKSRKAVLYRPSEKRVIQIGPLI